MAKVAMQKILVSGLMVGMLMATSGCAALVGGAVGAGGTATGYEVHLDNEKERVKEAYAEGRMSKEEHDIRLDQIQRDSAVQ